MTNEQLEQIIAEFVQILHQHRPDVSAFVMVFKNTELRIINGSGCPQCAFDNMKDWRDRNEITHIHGPEDVEMDESQNVH